MRWLVAVGVAAACSPSPPTRPATTPAVAHDATAPRDARAPAAALTAADCRAFATPRPIAIAVVAHSTPDCSGVGHARIVLDVVRLERGTGIARVVTSRPLNAPGEPAFAVGDHLVIAIEPGTRPAETVQCVALPAHGGTVGHAIGATSRAQAEQLLAQLVAARCPSP